MSDKYLLNDWESKVYMNESASCVSHWYNDNQQEKLKEGNIYVAWKSGRQDWKAAGPIGPTVSSREQSLLMLTSLFPFYSVWDISSRDGAIHTQSGSSVVILNQVKLTMKTKLHNEWWKFEKHSRIYE